MHVRRYKGFLRKQIGISVNRTFLARRRVSDLVYLQKRDLHIQPFAKVNTFDHKK